MSEKLHHEHEPDKVEYYETDAEKIDEKPSKHEKSHPVEKSQAEKNKEMEQIRHEAQEQAKSKDELLNSQDELEPEIHGTGQVFIDRELKSMAYHRLLKRAQRHLPGYERILSRIMHQPVVSAASEVVGQTVGRPSGILGGGIVAFLGSLGYYLLTRHYGYDYNFFVFTALLIGGFLIGWTIELLWRMLSAANKN